MKRYEIEAKKEGSDLKLTIKIDGKEDVSVLLRKILSLGETPERLKALPTGPVGATIDSLGFERGTQMILSDESEGGPRFVATVVGVA